MMRSVHVPLALLLGVATAAWGSCVTEADCPAMQCNTVACAAGECVYTPADELALCDDGDKCTLGERCLLGVCTPPLDAGRDSDHDGFCDSDEIACGCNPFDGNELCPLPNRLVGSAGSGFGEVLATWNTPTVSRVDRATDASCATAGQCTNKVCTRGKLQDACTTDADCDEPPDTCRVVVNWAAVPDLTLVFARLGGDPAPGFTVTPGCSRKIDLAMPAGRRTTLRLRAEGTVNGVFRRDRDTIRYR